MRLSENAHLPFEKPFDRLTVLSEVEGLMALSKVERPFDKTVIPGEPWNPALFLILNRARPGIQETEGDHVLLDLGSYPALRDLAGMTNDAQP